MTSSRLLVSIHSALLVLLSTDDPHVIAAADATGDNYVSSAVTLREACAKARTHIDNGTCMRTAPYNSNLTVVDCVEEAADTRVSIEAGV